jgi:peptidoglycan/xylan/chitin deacetylase (PgdA/CDA1 family)
MRYTIVTFDDAFKSIINNGVPVLEKAKTPFTLFIPAGQLGKNPGWLKNTGHRDECDAVSSIEELLRIPSEIATFGSHTINHSDLSQITHEEALTEIRDSKIILESNLKKEINYFSFPYGRYTFKIVECCNEAGYNQVFSTMPESPLAPLKKYVKGRIDVDPSDWYVEFILKILGGFGWRTFSSSIKQRLKKAQTCKPL